MAPGNGAVPRGGALYTLLPVRVPHTISGSGLPLCAILIHHIKELHTHTRSSQDLLHSYTGKHFF
jgi:hypothetical protein